MDEIDTKTGGNDMTTQYRGIKVNPKNTNDKNVNSVKGIYRGIKTDTKNEESTQPLSLIHISEPTRPY